MKVIQSLWYRKLWFTRCYMKNLEYEQYMRKNDVQNCIPNFFAAKKWIHRIFNLCRMDIPLHHWTSFLSSLIHYFNKHLQHLIIFLLLDYYYSYLLCVDDTHFFRNQWCHRHNFFASLCNMMQLDHTTQQKFCTNSLGMMQCDILTTNFFLQTQPPRCESGCSMWKVTNIQAPFLYLFCLTM